MYFISLFLFLASVTNCLIKLQRDFFWGGLEEEFKFHLVRWTKVSCPILVSGVGKINQLY
ncbi:hypothetical protein I3843_13G102700 [Carya illinoinensis]|uniref:Uncharacterized protein n=1 Tax=Carya illinoinensis TaxID=32201 RepID=A0A922D3C1_CARIL|nr:hypothetical protein I3760_13G116100 [Carya illinoinensis]KAG6619680.1 hypothetical protein I3842_Q088800 [Carya illinoinensis]KAG7950244.1 hypothetical protein I3843_13G102700 [Carya illinoinensis]